MRDFIAMLDGLGAIEQNVSPSAGGNYSGGATWADQFPTTPSGSGGLAASLAQRGYSVETVEPGGGQNYVGGATWFPGAPVYPSGQGGLARFSGYEVTVSPSGGDNYSGGATWSSEFPTLPSGQWGLAMASNGGDPLDRLIKLTRTILNRYGAFCASAGDRLLTAEREAERYKDWLRNGYGDPGLRVRAQKIVLRALAAGLQSVVVNCSGGGGWTRSLENQARAVLQMDYNITG